MLGRSLRHLARRLPLSGGLGPFHFVGHADQGFGPLTYAQFGEDLIVLNAFLLRGIRTPSFLDIGAHHPVNCSNTALLYERGSRGVCVEANPNLIAAFGARRPEDRTVCVGAGPAPGTLAFYMIDDFSGRNTFDKATAEAFVAAHPQFSIREVREIPVLTLDEIVSRYCGNVWPDFLSLDAEGLDYAILAASGFSAANGPKLICAETLSGGDDCHEAEIAALLQARGYAPEGRTLGNVIWGTA